MTPTVIEQPHHQGRWIIADDTGCSIDHVSYPSKEAALRALEEQDPPAETYDRLADVTLGNGDSLRTVVEDGRIRYLVTRAKQA